MIVTILLLTLAALALTHFVYEGILAPSFRAAHRLKLFALRDRLRKLKWEQGNELSDEVFFDLQSSINFAVGRLPEINLHLIRNAKEAFERNEKLRKQVESRIAMFEACPIEELHRIRLEYFDALDNVVLINSGGWMPYLIPVVIGFVLKESVRSGIKNIFSLPDNEIEKIAPPSPVLTPA
jgi:hypothetical protein